VSYPHGSSDVWACYHDEGGQLRKLPVGWTSLAPVDVFQVVADGRAAFRPGDLIALARLVSELLSACTDAQS
jgi:hypothetical protein